LRQRPGPGNSLGLIKFELPNPYDVYLHGTPAPELFARSRRDFSHGCIRVEDPTALAVWILRGNPGWTEERIRSAMNGDDTLRVNLPKPIPAWILYGTAVVQETAKYTSSKTSTDTTPRSKARWSSGIPPQHGEKTFVEFPAFRSRRDLKAQRHQGSLRMHF
jgi:murein L,D-transpeptidase YcbB/YkuD